MNVLSEPILERRRKVLWQQEKTRKILLKLKFVAWRLKYFLLELLIQPICNIVSYNCVS
jgi:hypothetical protein